MNGKLKELPVQKNGEYSAQVESLTHDGLGVARVEGFPVFLSNALPQEEVLFSPTLMKKNFAFGRVVDILKESPQRVTPLCPIYKQCGGCQLQHLAYPAQLEEKQQLVASHLARIGKLDAQLVLPTIGMEEPWRYRNKTQVPFGKDELGNVVAGFYKRRSHEIMDMGECLIQTEITDAIVRTVKELSQEFGIEPYDESSMTGIIRHLVVRIGFKTGEIMVTFVTKGKKFPYKDEVIERLLKEYKNIKSIAQNINLKATNVIFGDETRILYGEPYIYDELDGIRFAISPRSFYQINPIQTEILYKKAVEFAGLTGNEIVFDAYCGIGTITLFLARHAKKVYGVEIVPEAIADAHSNARLNGVENVQFEVGKSEAVIPKWLKEGIIPDVIVVDPPRKGCEKSLLEAFIEVAPKRIVYVSCDSSTLARDLAILAEGGYEVQAVQPVDMFPQTNHIENVALLTRV
ncbi:MAG: 23S rRNA (uracil(1939)-C(5))-methyltransferase RlmD [Turicibacter sp.]|nr:23S rRNA (uracil(1939)-C(5))-methyltransferase RlmD [Turicibacter sp.]